jgi:hypothetical protein
MTADRARSPLAVRKTRIASRTVITTCLRIVPALLALAACSQGGGQQVVVRDSAGVRIVESHQQVWSDADGWRVTHDPDLTIGVVEGDPAYQFFRITGVARLASGEIVVANGGSAEVRWYEPDGRFLRSAGRSGEGPGEYRWMGRLLVVSGDSVLVEDAPRDRMNLYSATGELVRSWTIEPLPTFVTPPPVGRLADGRFVAMTEEVLSEPPGYTPYRATVVSYRDGALVDTVTQFPGGESYYERCGPDNRSICRYGVPFARTAQLAVTSDRIVTGNGGRYELAVHTPDGLLAALYRRVVPLVKLTDARVGAYRDSIVALSPDQRRPAWRRALEAAPVPEFEPAFTELVVDALENVWVRRTGAHPPDETPWDVFDTEGRFLGTVVVPADLRVAQIGRDFVLGVSQDEAGVEYVRLHRLSR